MMEIRARLYVDGKKPIDSIYEGDREKSQEQSSLKSDSAEVDAHGFVNI